MTNTLIAARRHGPRQVIRSTEHSIFYVARLGVARSTRERRIRLRDDRGVPYRGRCRSPSRCARPISSATARRRCVTSTSSATTSRWAVRHVWQGWPGRPGRYRSADAPRGRADDRWHRGMSAEELLELADKVVAQAARASRSRRTSRGWGDRRPRLRGRHRTLRVGAERGHRRAGHPRWPHRIRLRRHPGSSAVDEVLAEPVQRGLQTVDEWAGPPSLTASPARRSRSGTTLWPSSRPRRRSSWPRSWNG